MNTHVKCLLTSIYLACFSTSSISIPSISSVEAVDGAEKLLINGSEFTIKANAKPLFYWSADEGIEPSDFGRKLSWDGSFNGELVSLGDSGVVIAPGSEKAVRMNYNETSGAILSKVSFDSDQLYVWRKRYDDFDADYAYAIRTRLNNVVAIAPGAVIEEGLIVHHASSGITGRIQEVSVDSGTATAYYERDFGNIADTSFTKDKVENGDGILVYAADDTSLSSPIISANINEGKGIYYSFNHKTIRLWGSYPGAQNNTYIFLGDGVDSPVGNKSQLTNEHTQTSTFWGSGWDQMIDHATRRWAREELQYQVSDIDSENGILFFWQDGKKGWEDKRFRFRTSAYPQRYSDLFMNQVSNGAAENSWEYYDSLYVDDTWHRVIACESSSIENCSNKEIQIPSEWENGSIEITPKLDAFSGLRYVYFYIYDADGNVNSTGYRYRYCPSCPKSPTSFSATKVN